MPFSGEVAQLEDELVGQAPQLKRAGLQVQAERWEEVKRVLTRPSPPRRAAPLLKSVSCRQPSGVRLPHAGASGHGSK